MTEILTLALSEDELRLHEFDRSVVLASIRRDRYGVIEKCEVTIYTSDPSEPIPPLPADGVLTLKPSDLLGPAPLNCESL